MKKTLIIIAVIFFTQPLFAYAFSVGGCTITKLVPLVVTCDSDTSGEQKAPSINGIIKTQNIKNENMSNKNEHIILNQGSYKPDTKKVIEKSDRHIDAIFGKKGINFDNLEIGKDENGLPSIANLSQSTSTKKVYRGSCVGTVFTKGLRLGDRSEEVLQLQKFLNQNAFTRIENGAGSKGKETNFFGGKTFNAVIKFQNLFKKDILTSIGLTRATGFWGASTIKKANQITSLCIE